MFAFLEEKLLCGNCSRIIVVPGLIANTRLIMRGILCHSRSTIPFQEYLPFCSLIKESRMYLFNKAEGEKP